MSRLPTDELFRIVPGRDPLQAIGDDTIRLRLDAAERRRLARQADLGYRAAVAEETLQQPEAI